MGVSDPKAEYTSFFDLERAQKREAMQARLKRRQDVYRRTVDLEKGIIKRKLDKELLADFERETKFSNVQYRFRNRAGATFDELSALELNFVHLEEVFANTEINRDRIVPYFQELAEDGGGPNLYDVADNVRDCYRNWQFDVYKKQKVKDLKHVTLCHNKFCPNCQKLIQASRLYRFAPAISELQNDYDVYHLTLTVENVTNSDLNYTVTKTFKSFSRLIKYFSGNTEAEGLSFASMGYGGAIRNLEIVYKGVKVDEETGEYVREYHPHIHAILLLKKGLMLDKHIKNKFSFSNRDNDKTPFSDEEILIQKVWKLIYDGDRVTKENVDKLDLGYSCKLDYVGDRIYEAFKYAIKLDKGQEFTYDVFRDYYFALHRRRCFQGYGKLYNIVGDDEIIEDVIDKYTEIIARLKLVEEPKEEWSDIEQVRTDVERGKYKIISKRAIYQALKTYKIPKLYEVSEDEVF